MDGRIFRRRWGGKGYASYSASDCVGEVGVGPECTRVRAGCRRQGQGRGGTPRGRDHVQAGERNGKVRPGVRFMMVR